MKRFLKKILSKFIKTKVLDEINVNGTTYRVVEKTCPFPFYKNKRALVFKMPGKNITFIHSMIYLNKRKKIQPTMWLPQKIIELWGKSFDVEKTLCLGAAGCAVPRFIAHSFPKSYTIGVEYVPEFVEIAKKYFLLDEIEKQFKLELGDAFKFVKNEELKNTQDLIFVDVFDDENVPDEVFSNEFLENLFNCLNDNSVAVFNLLTYSPSGAQKFAQSIKTPFDIKAVVVKNRRTALVLAKTKNEEKCKEFLNSLDDLGTTVVC